MAVEAPVLATGPLGSSLGPISFYLFICGCAFSSLLRGAFCSCGEWGLLSGCSASAPHCGGFSCREHRLQSTDFSGCSAQELWHASLVVLRHVGSSQIRVATCVSCIGRQKLNHWTTRKIQGPFLIEVKRSLNIQLNSPTKTLKNVKASTPKTTALRQSQMLQGTGQDNTHFRINRLTSRACKVSMPLSWPISHPETEPTIDSVTGMERKHHDVYLLGQS